MTGAFLDLHNNDYSPLFFDLSAVCISADPVTLLPAAEVFLLLSCFDAFQATLGASFFEDGSFSLSG